MTELEKNIGYTFKNIKLLEKAVTHSSYANERHCDSNECMEFLGDSVLSIVVSTYLYKKLNRVGEGVLSKTRAAMVCERALAELAHSINLGKFLKLGNGEDVTGGRERDSVLSDAVEAIIAAVYLDSGFETTEQWLLGFVDSILSGEVATGFHDYKSIFQELLQKLHKPPVCYTVLEEVGPDHNKDFLVELTVGNELKTTAHGSSKKEAEQGAAKKAIELMGKNK